MIGISMGDAAGIGPEVTLKALLDPDIRKLAQFVILGDSRYLDSIAKGTTGKNLSIYAFSNIKEISRLKNNSKDIAVLDFRNLPGRFNRGKRNKKIAQAALKYIRRATELALAGVFSAIVTAPVNKEAINRAGFRFSGHTEFLTGLCKVRRYAMMLIGGPWRVIPVTRHLPLKKVSSSLTKEKILEAIELGAKGLKQLGIRKPRLAVAALNPHGGEGGFLGEEEKRIISPAIKLAGKKGYAVFGPFPADTLFLPENRKKFDAQVVMYHDQGLIPLKMSGFGNAVNVTWGLPFIRTSPGHGTAYQLAGKGKADPGSMKEAIKLAVRLAYRNNGR
ncbi:MAG: 4-hydroxythreonine-4-phosphate dehydrogenase PdxA [Candidatus Ratteibacteria bacterium]|nr:4-hydroxythreonine-4-phosphate dehydrogenase PdxA [Candidatus Ratteibacteria bacterium]